uniref:Uncharacterized protein n=1 Tax=Panagrolaimus superbus TaxID=310955 RepID=A0A914YWW9_9BILA
MINSTASKFGEYFKYDENLPCEFDNSEMKFLASVECESMINCESGKEYHSNSKYSHPIYGLNRTCEACMKFICTSDNGKTVNNGYGCYEDFERACNFLDSDIKEKIKINIKDSFYYDKNYVVISCSDSDNCQLSIDSLLPYAQVVGKMFLFVFVKER